MIKLTATAIIHYISPVIDIPSRTGGNSFQKRELILDDSWTDRNNQPHSNLVQIEFSGDSMSQLDGYQPGQRVIVDAYVNGKEYQGRYFTTLRGQSIRPYQQPQMQGQPSGFPASPGYPQQATSYGAPAPAAFPQQAAYPQQPSPQQQAYPNQQAYPPQQPSAPGYQPQGSDPFGTPGNYGIDQLPFPTN